MGIFGKCSNMDTDRKSRRLSILSISSLDLSFKKRKRRLDDDELSLRSVGSTRKKNKKNTLHHIASLASIFSPSKRDDNDFKIPTTSKNRTPTPYKEPKPRPTQRRLTRTWSDMMIDVGYALPSALTNLDLKRQEAIFELYQGEVDLLEDLNVVKKMYLESMRKLNILSEDELSQIFGSIEDLIPVHKDLISKLKNQRKSDGTTCAVGDSILDWVPKLRPYIDYCSNQVFSKPLLDEKKCDPSLDDFLRRCMESPFSRKLDLWTLLDGARSRFMKYPLLIKSIQKYTRPGHSDMDSLEKAITRLESIISEADLHTGQAKCTYYRCRLSYLFEDQHHPSIDSSQCLVLNGVLKNNKGTKLHIFLYDRVLIVTRLTTHTGRPMYQVYRDPIPLHDLVLDDLKDGATKVGSFRSAFSNSTTGKYAFRVSFRVSNDGQSHTLLANDEHNKRQWTTAISKAIQSVEGEIIAQSVDLTDHSSEENSEQVVNHGREKNIASVDCSYHGRKENIASVCCDHDGEKSNEEVDDGGENSSPVSVKRDQCREKNIAPVVNHVGEENTAPVIIRTGHGRKRNSATSVKHTDDDTKTNNALVVDDDGDGGEENNTLVNHGGEENASPNVYHGEEENVAPVVNHGGEENVALVANQCDHWRELKRKLSYKSIKYSEVS